MIESKEKFFCTKCLKVCESQFCECDEGLVTIDMTEEEEKPKTESVTIH